MPDYPTLAAVDLGSNSFHLQVARVVGEQIYPLDQLREPVRLGAGLNDAKLLDQASQARALECLSRFGERLRGLPRGAVRAVGTNALRVAKNASVFLKRAQAALGVPIEVIAGREEARLIYLGVAHSLPSSRERRLVVDIGGGSTEFIIGSGLKPLKLDSIYMGCVSWTLRYFPDRRVTKAALREAELAARAALQTMAAGFSRSQWSQAVASSGTARALAELIQAHGLGDGTITPAGLDALRLRVLKAGDFDRLLPEGLRADRAAVLPGGLAIMTAVVAELGAERIAIANGALRQGILWDLLGRVHHHDMRDVTAAQFMQRYHVDSAQSKRVARLADALLRQIVPQAAAAEAAQFLYWAAKLHEIGITVAYNGYHKHSAYILRNADMPGFSRMEQERLALLVLAHRGQLRKLGEVSVTDEDWPLVAALRLAVLLNRSRTSVALPELTLKLHGRRFTLGVPEHWLGANPLTQTALDEETKQWRGAEGELEIRVLRDRHSQRELPNAA
ncbi:MAG: exopolyphosphatase [Burkholderiales bacterium]|nr:exopolyphosphatase [Burkholderiales bacterium]